jgi:hypothetical protein
MRAPPDHWKRAGTIAALSTSDHASKRPPLHPRRGAATSRCTVNGRPSYDGIKEGKDPPGRDVSLRITELCACAHCLESAPAPWSPHQHQIGAEAARPTTMSKKEASPLPPGQPDVGGAGDGDEEARPLGTASARSCPGLASLDRSDDDVVNQSNGGISVVNPLALWSSRASSPA